MADEEVYLVVEATEEMTKENILKQLRSDKYFIDTSAMPDHIILLKYHEKEGNKKLTTSYCKK